MPRFLGVEGYNFCTYRKFKFDMNENSVFIKGSNKDAISIESNGVGKSLIIDAIVWSPFDITVRGFSKDKVIGRFDDYTYVTTNWKDDNDRDITITRFRNHKRFKNDAVVKINGEDASKFTNVKDLGTNNQIKQLLGIDGIAFTHSIVFSKGRSSLCDEKESGRRKLLSHIIGLDVIDKGYKEAQKERKELTKILHSLEIKSATSNTELLSVESRISETEISLKEVVEKFEKRKIEYQKIHTSIKDKKDKFLNEKEKLELELKQVIDSLKDQKKIKNELQKQNDKIDDCNDRIDKFEYRLKLENNKYNAAKESLIESKKSQGTTCPTCKQFISPSHVRTQLYELQTLVSDAKLERNKTLAIINKHKEKIKDLEDFKSEIEKLLDKELENKKYRLEMRLEDVIEELDSIKEFKNEIEDDTESLNKRLKELQNEYSLLKDKVELINKNKKKVEIKLSIADFWVRGFGNKGLKSYIINSVLDFLEENTNFYLDKLTDGYMNVSWGKGKDEEEKDNEKLFLNVKTGNRGDKEYHHCSDGERARVWLAMELALNSILRSTIDLALVDEAFDGLDSEGLKRAIDLISSEGLKRKIICISHRKGIEQFFKERKLVIMENDESRLESA